MSLTPLDALALFYVNCIVSQNNLNHLHMQCTLYKSGSSCTILGQWPCSEHALWLLGCDLQKISSCSQSCCSSKQGVVLGHVDKGLSHTFTPSVNPYLIILKKILCQYKDHNQKTSWKTNILKAEGSF